MLVLLRRVGESICIGDEIVVTLLAMDRWRARVGILADRSIPINGNGRHASPKPGKPGRGLLVKLCHAGESFWIGGAICVTVVALERGRVRFGVDAEKWMPVDRAEIREKKMRDAPPLVHEAPDTETAPPRIVPIRYKKRKRLLVQDGMADDALAM